MADSNQENPTSESGTPPVAPQTPSYFQGVYEDLSTDIYGIGDRALWNMATLYPYFYYGVDNMIFNSRDGDLMASVKMAGLVASMNESQKLAKKILLNAGVDPKYFKPLQTMRANKAAV